ncbi:hypothetical protein HXX76_005895 [Chlamydomonas incerta]|uniref:Uncharacterized protein n=1 Tax=Chlamydomonas incerta TaxID=51695 RepID=A0A835W1L9_CHLIN|nr:hypothetical protein HXX76_005895 [Chlamydomonas incerta]|eukprot:KAG2437232.1 hypothetical protein HXX76_005895 [Chlamydomonas incerta]
MRKLWSSWRGSTQNTNIFNSAIRSKSYKGRCLLRAYAQAVVGRVDDPDARQAAIEAAEKLRVEAIAEAAAAAAAAAAAKALATEQDVSQGPSAVGKVTQSVGVAGGKLGAATAAARTGGTASAGAGRRAAAAALGAASDSPFAQHLPQGGIVAPSWATGTAVEAQQHAAAAAAPALFKQSGGTPSGSGTAIALSGRTPSGRRRLRPPELRVKSALEPQPAQQGNAADSGRTFHNGSTLSPAGPAGGAEAYSFAKGGAGTAAGAARGPPASADGSATQHEFRASLGAAAQLPSGAGEAAARKVRIRIAGGAPSTWGPAGLVSTAAAPSTAAPVVTGSAQPGVLASSGTCVQQLLPGGPARFSDPGLTSSRLFGRSDDEAAATQAAAAYLSAAGTAAAPTSGKLVGKRASDSAAAYPAFSYPRQLPSTGASAAAGELAPAAAGGMLGSPGAFAVAPQQLDSGASTGWAMRSHGDIPVTSGSHAPLFASATWHQQYTVPAAAAEQPSQQAAQHQHQQYLPWQLHSIAQLPGGAAATAAMPPFTRASCSALISDSGSGVVVASPQPYFRSGSGGRLGMSGLLVMLDAYQPSATAAPDNPDAMLEAYRDAAWLQPPPSTHVAATAAAEAAAGEAVGGAAQQPQQVGASPQLAAAGFGPPLHQAVASDAWQCHDAPQHQHQQQQPPPGLATNIYQSFHTQPTWMPAQPSLHATSSPSLFGITGPEGMAASYLQSGGTNAQHRLLQQPQPCLLQTQQLPQSLPQQQQLERQQPWTGGAGALNSSSSAADQLHSGSLVSGIGGGVAGAWARCNLEAGSAGSGSLLLGGAGGGSLGSGSCLSYLPMDPELLPQGVLRYTAAGRVGMHSADGSAHRYARPAGAAGGGAAAGVASGAAAGGQLPALTFAAGGSVFSGDDHPQPGDAGGVRRDSGLGNPVAPQPLSLRRCSTQPSPPEVPTAAAAVQPPQSAIASAPASAAFEQAPVGGAAAAAPRTRSCGPSAAAAAIIAAGAAVTCSGLHPQAPRDHATDERALAPGLRSNADVWTVPAAGTGMDCSGDGDGDGGVGGSGSSHGVRTSAPQLPPAIAAGAVQGEGQGMADFEAWVHAGRSGAASADQPGWAELYGSMARFGGHMDGGCSDGDGDILMRDCADGGER